MLPEDVPDELVPWASLFFKGDAVTLSHHRHRAGASGIHSPAPKRVPRSPPRDTNHYEAGPWAS